MPLEARAIRRDIGGMLPVQNNGTANPMMQNSVQQYQQMTPEQLQQLVLRLGNTAQGQAAQRVLQQKRTMPTQSTGGAPVMPMAPQTAPVGTGMAEGGALHRAAGGPSPSMEMPWFERTEARDATSGYLHGSTLGRADALRTTAPSGSYVLPADVVSGLGEGNSMAGARIVQQALGSGPWGTPLSHVTHGAGPPRAPSINTRAPRLQSDAKGGGVQGGEQPGHIPVMLSHGEFVVTPEQVRAIGGGNQKDGWKILDEFVKESRRRTIEKMKKLPGPAK